MYYFMDLQTKYTRVIWTNVHALICCPVWRMMNFCNHWLIFNFDRNFDRKNTNFWPKLAILTEILTENHRSEKRWSKLIFDRSVKKFWPNFWPKLSVKIRFDRHFDRKCRSKYFFTKILTVFFGQKLKFWPKFWPKIRSE